MLLEYSSGSRHTVLLAVDKWLHELNLNPSIIRRVTIQSETLLATIHNSHGGSKEYQLKRLPDFAEYELLGLAPCGHHLEDSSGIMHCLSCVAGRPVLDIKRGHSE